MMTGKIKLKSKIIRLLVSVMLLAEVLSFGPNVWADETSEVYFEEPEVAMTPATTKKLKLIGAKSKVKWSSSNKKYATVSSSGKVKALKAGKGKKVKITAMATDGSGKKKTVVIKIK